MTGKLLQEICQVSCRNAHNGLIYCGYLLPVALRCLVYNYMMQCVVKPSGGGLIRFRTPGASCYPPVHVPDLAATYSRGVWTVSVHVTVVFISRCIC